MTSTSFVVLLQVTVISVVGIAMSFAARRNAALRHTIAFLSLTLVVLSPLLTRLLPLQWRGLMAESTEATASIEAVRDDQVAMTEPMHPERLMPTNETVRSVKPDSHPVDGGAYANLPEKWTKKALSATDIVEIIKWAAEEGFDMMGDEFKDEDGKAVYAIRTIGLQAWQLDDSRWKSLPSKFTPEQLKSEGHLVTGEWLLFRDSESGKIDPQKNAPFFFVTREGTPGVLYVGIPVIDDSLKPGGATLDDNELDPVAFQKGRRFGFKVLVPAEGAE